jgi:predicted nuclease of predicted toxin-antitoxin system
MRFKVDENLPIEVAELLQQAGHDAVTVLGQGLGGRADPDIASMCQREGRALVTLDTDFADIRAYPPRDFPGLIVLRLKRQDKLHVLETLRHVTSVLSIEPLQHRLWIVEEGQVRIRS